MRILKTKVLLHPVCWMQSVGRLVANLKEWKMLFVDQPVSDELPYPFFIEWETPEEIRLEQLRAEGTLTEENEELEIRECIFGVEDPLRDTGEWAVLLSQKVGDSNDILLDDVGWIDPEEVEKSRHWRAR